MARLQRGRINAQTPEVSDIRVLKREDLAVLAVKRPPNSIQTLRDTHHRVARAVAAGLRNDEIATLTGFSYNRVSVLKADPSFIELVAHYRGLITAEYVRAADPVIEYMASNALKAQAMLSDRLDAQMRKAEFAEEQAALTGEPVEPSAYGTVSDLLGIAELGLDRTGYGKVNKNLNVNVDFAANLEAARKRASGAHALRQIEHESPSAAQSPQDDSHAVRRAHPVASPFRRL